MITRSHAALAALLGTLMAIIPAPASAQAPRDIAGSWTGALNVGGMSLRLVFHVARDSAGELVTKMDSPDQGALGIPVTETIFAADSVKFIIGNLGAEFAGTISPDGARMEGRFRQGGADLALALARGQVEPPKRPQNPALPLPYDALDVTFANATGGNVLAGTLTVPRSAGPHPAVVLISGSGPQDRDESLLGHKPFLVLADHLTRNGIAVLRYDDRGVGASTGAFATATSQDFMMDALAAVAFLKSRSGIDAAKIGLAGHSEGGLIAPMAATRTSDVAFLVLLAGPGVNGEEILYLQAAKIMRAAGVPEPVIARNREMQKVMFDIVKQEPDAAAAAERMRTRIRESLAGMSAEERQMLGAGSENTDAAIEMQVRQVNSPWFRYFLTYDPATALTRVTVPVLALNGELDLQVPHDQNLPAIEAALRAAGNRDVTARILPRLNHLFQTATTGAPAEYANIEETFSPAALGLIASWINARFGPKR